MRFVELFHEAWDQHGNLVNDIKKNCRDTDQACAALVTDLKQRGLLDDTLVIWGGEFGRTPMVEGDDERRPRPPSQRLHDVAGRRRHQAGHHARRDATSSASTSPSDRVHVHDLHATILHLLGFDHERFTFKFQGLDQKLTGVEPAHVVHGNSGVARRPA